MGKCLQCVALERVPFEVIWDVFFTPENKIAVLALTDLPFMIREECRLSLWCAWPEWARSEIVTAIHKLNLAG